ncbi:hypothetical protein [Clostridium tagluense]|uniref:hypothetical protein n=1 Tax=Clostridium tagluense TaxID=360422 RepID=UPI001C6EDD6C|nr:hypothetical protein [Clostridium tagluense]MBW9158082.1 hypothetical protein [Clostridium tagluense]WLC65076.1 hypothetical protein KTC93_20005 [Clostridium tagluense]
MNKKMCNLVIAIAVSSFTVPTLTVSARTLKIIEHPSKLEQKLATDLQNLKNIVGSKNQEQPKGNVEFKARITLKRNQIKGLEMANYELKKQIDVKLIKVGSVVKKSKTDKIEEQKKSLKERFKILGKGIELKLINEGEKNFEKVLDAHITKLKDRNAKLVKLNGDIDKIITVILTPAPVPVTTPIVTPTTTPVPTKDIPVVKEVAPATELVTAPVVKEVAPATEPTAAPVVKDTAAIN